MHAVASEEKARETSTKQKGRRRRKDSRVSVAKVDPKRGRGPARESGLSERGDPRGESCSVIKCIKTMYQTEIRLD